MYAYQLLGLTPGAGPDEVKRAYRTLARRYHPDVNAAPEATQQFLLITDAYRQVLREAERPSAPLNPATAAVENVYYQQRKSSSPPPSFVESTPAEVTVPPLLRWAMDSLVGITSLFLMLVPLLVYYQLAAKGLAGWPSLAFFPLVIGGAFGIYQTMRSHYRLA